MSQKLHIIFLLASCSSDIVTDHIELKGRLGSGQLRTGCSSKEGNAHRIFVVVVLFWVGGQLAVSDATDLFCKVIF